jgi:hypothetical protein
LGVQLKSKEDDYAAITEEPAVDFHNLAAAALDNAGNDINERLRTARDLANTAAAVPRNNNAALIEAAEDEILYDIITFSTCPMLAQPRHCTRHSANSSSKQHC